MALASSEFKKATDVRKHWSEFFDAVVREKPQFVKKTRDSLFAVNLDTLKELLAYYTFNVTLLKEDDGTITASLNELNIITNGKDTEEAISLLVDDIVEYSEEYYNEFSYWITGQNTRKHLPYILNVLIQNDKEGVKSLINAEIERA